MAEYGLPTWGSYLIFAIATIFIGAILGLVSIQFCLFVLEFCYLLNLKNNCSLLFFNNVAFLQLTIEENSKFDTICFVDF